MFPLRFLLGVATGAIAVLLVNPSIANRARPVAKAALKRALKAAHGAQVSGTELAEAAEDLYAEAKMEVTAEVLAEAMAAAKAKAAEKAATPNGARSTPMAAASTPVKKRAPRKRAKPSAVSDA